MIPKKPVLSELGVRDEIAIIAFRQNCADCLLLLAAGDMHQGAVFTGHTRRTNGKLPQVFVTEIGMMAYRNLIMSALGLAIAGGCSTDDLQHLGFFAFQNLGQQQCQKAMRNDCDKKENYDQYQKERQEISQ